MEAAVIRRERWKAWEALLVLFALLLFFAGLYGYVTDIGLRRFLFSLKEDEDLIAIGRVVQVATGSKRQLISDPEFKPLVDQTTLYNRDTIVTGPDAGLHIELNDGGVIDLAPNTMVQLVFETQYGLSGIKRQAGVNVISGEVTGASAVREIKLRAAAQEIAIQKQKKETLKLDPVKPIVLTPPVAVATRPPAPSASPLVTVASQLPAALPSGVAVAPLTPPAPSALEILSPLPGSTLSVPKESKQLARTVNFSWRIKPAAPKLLLRVFRGDSASRPVFQREVSLKSGVGAIDWTATQSGNYTWQLLSTDARALDLKGRPTQFTFRIDPRVQGIELLDPLIAGKLSTSNQVEGQLVKNFSVTLRWKAEARVSSSYTLWFGATADSAQPMMEKVVDRAEFSFNKDKLFASPVFYRVQARVDSWVLTSETKKFLFNFLPPILVVPEDRSTVSPEAGVENTILFTWQKTNFTEGYELELAADPKFKKMIEKKVLKENYHVLPMPKPGVYYWRARAFSKTVSSSYGKANEFTVTQ